MQKTFTFLICLLILSSIVIAEQTVEPTFLVQEFISTTDRFKLEQELAQPFAIVGGGQCDISPDDAGAVRNLINTNFQVFCPNEVSQPDITGCRLCEYDQFYGFIRCRNMDPDNTITLSNEKNYWERYNCYKQECIELSEFKNKGCGEGSCSDTSMLREREDSCGNIDIECVPNSACRDEQCTESVTEWSTCSAGQQTRTRTEAGCTKTKETQACGKSGEGGIQNIIIGAESEVAYVDDGNIIVGEVDLSNGNKAMSGTFIIEMQVVPEGQSPFAVVGEVESCDPDHPENVHIQFKLDANEDQHIKLRTLEAMEDGKYDVFFLTRTKCFKDLTEQEQQNIDSWRTLPYPTSEKITTVCVGDDCFEDESKTGFTVNGFFIVGIVIIIIAAIVGFNLKKKKRGRR